MSYKFISIEKKFLSFKEDLEKTLGIELLKSNGCIVSNSDIFYCLEQFKKTIQKQDIIIIDASGDDIYDPEKRLGLNVFKWLRIRFRLLNPILVLGQEKADDWLKFNPQDIIIVSEGVKFLNDYNQVSQNIPFIKALTSTNDLKPFVKADFKVSEFGHDFANEYGLELMTYANNKANKINTNLKETLPNAKASFLYDFRFIKSDIKKIDRIKEGIAKKHKRKKVFYIDDQGEKGWFNLMKDIFSDLSISGYVPNLENQNFQNEIKNAVYIMQPDLILLDFRLNPEKDKGLNFYRISGYKVLKVIKKSFPHIPVIIVSATNKTEVVNQFIQANAEAHWGKPRIESLNFSLSETYLSLLTIVDDVLEQYSAKIDKQLKLSEFYLQKIKDSYKGYANNKLKQSKDNKANYIRNSDSIVLDTNFFRAPSYKYQVAFYTLLLYAEKNSKRIIIIDDVFQELFIGASRKIDIKDKKGLSDKKICQYSLNKIQKYFDEFPKQLTKGYQIMSWFSDDSFEYYPEGDSYHLFSLKKRLKSIHSSEVDAIKAKESAIESGKKALHADDSFKYLINYVVLNTNYNNALFINDDYGAKKQAIDLLRDTKTVTDSNIKYNEDNTAKPISGEISVNTEGKLFLLSGKSLVNFIWDKIAKEYFKR